MFACARGGPHLVQRGLGHRVVLDAQQALVLGQDGEDVSEGGKGGGQLVLQHVPVLLLQDAARQLPLDELPDGRQVGVRPRHAQDAGVAVTKPAGGGGAMGMAVSASSRVRKTVDVSILFILCMDITCLC